MARNYKYYVCRLQIKAHERTSDAGKDQAAQRHELSKVHPDVIEKKRGFH